MPLEPDNQRLLTAAQGYLELGLPLDANQEIESMAADVRHVPEFLAVRVGIYRALEAWPLMQVVARQLARTHRTSRTGRLRGRLRRAGPIRWTPRG